MNLGGLGLDLEHVLGMCGLDLEHVLGMCRESPVCAYLALVAGAYCSKDAAEVAVG